MKRCLVGLVKPLSQVGTYSLGMRNLPSSPRQSRTAEASILDEPITARSSGAPTDIRLIREMRESGDMNIILCSHLLRDVEETCEEVLILKQGDCALRKPGRSSAQQQVHRNGTLGRRTFAGDIESGMRLPITAITGINLIFRSVLSDL